MQTNISDKWEIKHFKDGKFIIHNFEPIFSAKIADNNSMKANSVKLENITLCDIQWISGSEPEPKELAPLLNEAVKFIKKYDKNKVES